MRTNTSTSANRLFFAALCGAALLTAGCFRQYPGDPDPNAPRPPRQPAANANNNSGAAPAPVPGATRGEGR